MRSPVVPWVLLALVVGAWATTAMLGDDGAPPASSDVLWQENETLRAEIGRLGTENEALRGAKHSEEPSLHGSETAGAPAGAARPDAQADPRAEARAEAWRAWEERSKRRKAAYAVARPWFRGLEAVDDRREREEAIAAIRTALDSNDPDTRLAGLFAAGGLGDLEYDREGFRAALLEHVHRTDQLERRAAREALTTVNPQREDLAMWVEEALTATNEYAETVAGALVSSDGWRIESPEAEDAVLHLLRDGTDINRANLLRGLQCARSFSPRVEARLIELVRGENGRGSGMTTSFYHFLDRAFRPMAEDMLEMVLGHVATDAYMEGALRFLQRRLTDDQMTRVAARLLDIADDAGTGRHLHHLLGHFRHLDGHGDPDRLQEFANDEEIANEIRALASEAAAAARRRQRR